jgi:hypothetical protein
MAFAVHGSPFTAISAFGRKALEIQAFPLNAFEGWANRDCPPNRLAVYGSTLRARRHAS